MVVVVEIVMGMMVVMVAVVLKDSDGGSGMTIGKAVFES